MLCQVRVKRVFGRKWLSIRALPIAEAEAFRCDEVLARLGHCALRSLPRVPRMSPMNANDWYYTWFITHWLIEFCWSQSFGPADAVASRNILLMTNDEGNLQIKLIDFGMAAIQQHRIAESWAETDVHTFEWVPYFSWRVSIFDYNL